MKNFKISYVGHLFNFVVGTILLFIAGLFFPTANINPLYGGLAADLLSIVLSTIAAYTGHSLFSKYVFFAGLLKEIWISRLMEKFYPTAEWLNRAQDFSSMVEFNTINLAEIGADPDVLVNNTSYPVPFADRTDVPVQLPLDYYDTKGTVVRNAEAIQLAYNKMDTVINQHGKALAKAQSGKAAWNFAPTQDGTYTPVMKILGGYATLAAATAALGAGTRIPFDFTDIINHGQKYDELDLPQQGRVLVLSTQHKADLLKADIKLYKSLTNQTKGEMLMQYGSFDIYVSTQTPTYNGTTGVKKAYGAAAAGTDARSSFSFIDTEVMRAKGTMDMFSRLRDPEARGDIVGFQQRFIALSIRGKYTGALIDQLAA